MVNVKKSDALKIEQVPVGKLKVDDSNARAHKTKGIDAIKRSLTMYSQQKPIVVDANGVVVAGNGTLQAAVELGCRELKFFPAEPSGGMKYLSSMKAPYDHLGLRFIPLGGLNVQNMGAYLADPAVPAIGGSWIAPRKLIQQQDWATITANATEARRIIDDVRKKDTP